MKRQKGKNGKVQRQLQQSWYSRVRFLLAWLAIVTLLVAPPAAAQRSLAHEFAGADFYSEEGWLMPGGEDDPNIDPDIRHTRWAGKFFTLLPPGEKDMTKRYARFPLRRYDSSNPGIRYKGTHVRTIKAWNLTGQNPQLEFTAKIRLPDRREGVLAAFFVYEESDQSKMNEIDFEFPQHLLASDHLWLNVHQKINGQYKALHTVNGDSAPIKQVSKPAGFWSEWRIYKIRWTQNSVTWYIDGEEVHTIPNQTLNLLPNPSTKFRVHLNIWSPHYEWRLGQDINGDPPDPPYSPSQNPNVDPLFPDFPEKGRGNYYDVAWIEVRAGKVEGR